MSEWVGSIVGLVVGFALAWFLAERSFRRSESRKNEIFHNTMQQILDDGACGRERLLQQHEEMMSSLRNEKPAPQETDK